MLDSDLVKKMLRAVLQSSKEGLMLHRVQFDFQELCGETIPFKKMGFPKLEDYLKSIPSVVRLENQMGQLRCFGVACKDTAHVAELVARQKSSKKSGHTQINCRMRFQPATPYRMNVRPKTSLRQPAAAMGFSSSARRSWPYSGGRGMSATGDYRQFDKNFRTATPVEHRQPAPQPALRQCVKPESKEKTFKIELRTTEMPPKQAPTLTKTEKTELSPYDVTLERRRITQLLERYCSGLWLSKLSQVYSEKFHEDLHPQVLIDLETWTDICVVEPIKTNEAIRVIYPPLPPKPALVPLNTTKSPPKSVTSSPKSPCTPPVQTQTVPNKSPLAKPTFIFPPPPTAAGPSSPASPVKSQSPSPSRVLPPCGAIQNKQDTRPLSPSFTSGTTPTSVVPPIQRSPNLSPSKPASQSCPAVSAELLQRVEELLSKYSQGVWSHALPRLFMDMYKTPFPQHILDNLSLLCQVSTVDYPLPYDKSKAILYKTIRANKDITQSPRNPLPSGLEILGPVVPPKLGRPTEQYPSVLVTEAKSTKSVTIRYVGEHFSHAQVAMEKSMQAFYTASSSQKPLSNLRVGQLAAVKEETSNEYTRAQITKIISPNKVMVYFLDYGFSTEISDSNVCELHQDFLSLPFQATHVILSGLEAFSSHHAVLSHLEEMALEKILLMEILEPATEETPVVVLYDTSQDIDININSSCMKVLRDNTMNNPLKEEVVYGGVRVTDVCADGTIYCQLPSRGTARLGMLMEETEAYFLSQMTSEFLVSRPFNGKYCLARYKDKWARAEIISVYDNRVIDILFVDLGVTATVEVTDIREIPSLVLKDFTVIPPQATKCRLADLRDAGNWTQEVVQKVKEAVQGAENCKIKISPTQKLKEEQVLSIYLYVGEDGHGLHESINWWTAKSEVLQSSPIQTNTDLNSRSRRSSADSSTQSSPTRDPAIKILSGTRSGPVPPPLKLPQPGENMDIYVPVACHPGYFVVQRWDESHKLGVLKGEMMLYYNKMEKSSTNPPIVKGEIYAAKVEKNWLRVVVKGVLARELVSIYQLDEGKHELVRSTAIQPLKEEFRQLPFQAIPAQLAGVTPRQWSEEASILFRNYVENKALVARVQSVQQGNGVPWESKLTVFLADTTSQEEDLWIHTVMADIDSWQAA